jgi:hypothetical protein
MQNSKNRNINICPVSVSVDPRSPEWIKLWLEGGVEVETQKPHDSVDRREEQEALAEQGFTKPAGVRETVVGSNRSTN